MIRKHNLLHSVCRNEGRKKWKVSSEKTKKSGGLRSATCCWYLPMVSLYTRERVRLCLFKWPHWEAQWHCCLCCYAGSDVLVSSRMVFHHHRAWGASYKLLEQLCVHIAQLRVSESTEISYPVFLPIHIKSSWRECRMEHISQVSPSGPFYPSANMKEHHPRG